MAKTRLISAQQSIPAANTGLLPQVWQLRLDRGLWPLRAITTARGRASDAKTTQKQPDLPSQKRYKCGSGDRPADEVALNIVAAARSQEIDLRLGFHPFGNHLHLQFLRQ